MCSPLLEAETLLFLLFNIYICRRIPTHIGEMCFATTMLFNIILQIPRFLELTLEQKLELTQLRENPVFIILTMVLAIMFLNVMPLFILIFINISLYQAVMERSRRLIRLSSRRVRIGFECSVSKISFAEKRVG